MRIGFFGNANNYPFILARALRRMGHDVLFIVDRPEPLNRPESRYADIGVPYPDWIVDLSPLDLHVAYETPPAGRARAIELLNECDAVVVNMLGPSLIPDLRPPAIALLTGTDLEVYANYGFIRTYLRAVYRSVPLTSVSGMEEYVRTALSIRRLVARQRVGIRRAVAVNYFAPGLVPRGDALLARIGVQAPRRLCFLMADTALVQPRPMRANATPRVFCVARLTWKVPGRRPRADTMLSELDYKGTDVMVRGLAKFVKRSGIELQIRLVRKGRQVAETEQLVISEGLDGMVTWLDELTQREVLEEYAAADVVFDQLDHSIVGMGGLEALAAGRPVIANARPEVENPACPAPSPVCHAATAEDVCAQLERLLTAPAERELVGSASRAYAETHCSPERAARLCLERFRAAA